MSGQEAGAQEAGGPGVFLVDKPTGRSSFAIVRRVRHLLQIKKVGHAGTLDPFASGLLILCAGREATRNIALFMQGHKYYQATLQLGVETSTQDPEGEIVRTCPVRGIDREAICACLGRMTGEQLQTPPAFSALKHQGRPLYSYARQGIFISKPARMVSILTLEAGAYDADRHRLDIRVRCSRGTYIRTLAADIGAALGCGAHLIALRRLASGPFQVAEALDGRLLFQEEGRAVLLAARLEVDAALARIGHTDFTLPEPR